MGSLKVRLQFFFVLLLGVMLLGTVGFRFVEGLSFLNAFYFTIVTIATVGYGDITPVTPLGKILTIALIVCGVGTFLAFIVSATEGFLVKRETEQRKEKLRMVLGIFFTEFGTDLLARLSRCDPTMDAIKTELLVRAQWSSKEFSRARKALKGYTCNVDTGKVDLQELKDMLQQKSELFLRLFENPNLLEHESFAELLRAILHLKEELLHRNGFSDLPQSDVDHLAGDIRRVYTLLISEWLDYMRYLKDNFPYLFSLAMRLNPFDSSASPVVRLPTATPAPQ
jgi:voltage-gated potassium channel